MGTGIPSQGLNTRYRAGEIGETETPGIPPFL